MATETLAQEAYEASRTSETYTLRQMRWEGTTPDPFWTWSDARGYGPSLGPNVNRHATRDQAIAALEEHLRIEAIKAETWTRGQYEAACLGEWGEGAASHMRADRDMATIVEWNADTWTPFYAFAVARLKGIKAEAPVPGEPVAKCPSKMVNCPNCGAETLPALLISASLGIACPNCYDELSS